METTEIKTETTESEEKRLRKKRISKAGRIIIRNLSFKATEDAVHGWFARYGQLQDVKVLKKADGTLVGCAFVQFKDVSCAAKAIKECNAKPFLGRPIAIDWAIPKQQYAQNTNRGDTSAVEEESKPTEKADSEADSDDENAESGEESDEEDDNSEESEEDEEADQKSKQTDWKGQSHEKERGSDVAEGRTVFIRNMDFSTAQDSLKNYMEQFGDIHYAVICMDKVMERPRGTAFVKFKDAEAVEKCLQESRNSSLYLDGRTLDAVVAVTRDDLEQKKQLQKKEHKDNRNMYLAREGMIRAGTLAAQGVSAADLAIRQQNELWKKQMLRNLHMFISRERLCVHNLPPKLTDKQLKKLFLKYSPEGAKIAEARVMRDLKKVVEGKNHPSKGYGFVTFAKHEDALEALRNINNNPDIFTKDKRPIVEFSVENRAALKAKSKREQASIENANKAKGETKDANKAKYESKKAKRGKREFKTAITPSTDAPEFSGAKADPKIKTLPSHSGPKIRHKKRPEPTEAQGPLSKKPKISRKAFKNPDKKKTFKEMKEEPNVIRGQKAKWFD